MILFRYFAREVLVNTFVVTAIVLVISMGWRFSGYLDKAAAGAMTREVLLALMAYRMPGFLELILPVSFFLSIMLVYGRLHVDNEMVVLESTGMSPWRLKKMTLLMAGVVMLLTGAVALWLKPMGEREVEALLAGQKNLTEFDTLIPGRFQTLSSGQRVTYTEEIVGNGELSGVFINEYKDSIHASAPRDAVTVMAEAGQTQVDDLGRRFLVLQKGTRYRGRPGEPGYQVVEFEEYGQLVETDGYIAGEKRTTAILTLSLLGVEDAESRSELQWRLSIILMIPVLALMAIPLARVNPRQGRFTRLVPAMILCFLYVILLSGAKSGVERGNLSPMPGLWAVHLLFAVIVLLTYQLDRFVPLLQRLVIRR